MFAKSLLIKIQQTMPVRILVLPHRGELLSLFGIILLQTIRKIVVDARILFFQ